MNFINNLQLIISELKLLSSQINEKQLLQIAEDIKKAHHIFISGAGRSGIAIKAFANRLLHLGFSVSIVGEITSPHSNKDDLLIIASGSGETTSLLSLAKKASSNNIKIALFTMNPKSSIANLSNNIIVLPGSSKMDTSVSKQPMGSSFEQLCFLTYDAIILTMMTQLNETNDSMLKRHADLE